MISNRCARKSLVTNCNSIISKNYLRFLVDSNDHYYELYMMALYRQGMCQENKSRTNRLCISYKRNSTDYKARERPSQNEKVALLK